MRKTRHGVWRGIDTSTATSHQLGSVQMRRTVGTKKETAITGNGRRNQGAAVTFTLGNRQAIIMRANTTSQNMIAVDKQMMRCDCGGNIGTARTDIINTITGGYMFQHNP